MKNTQSLWKRLRGCFLAFLIVALAFLAVGLGTLGSTTSVGNAFELRADRTEDNSTSDNLPGVVFKLTNPQDDEGNTVYLRVADVYVNVAAIYAEAGTPVSLRIQRSTSGTYYNNVGKAVSFENFTTPLGDVDGDKDKDEDVAAPDVRDGFFRFVAPFTMPDSTWRVSSYPYVKVLLDGKDGANILLNEVVFVGEVLDSSSSSAKGTGEYRVISATVETATQQALESMSEAVKRAEALLDAQSIPSLASSSFNCFSKEEVYTLMTIAEMRLGNVYVADREENPLDTYTVDNVYGTLGTDILALGTLMFGMSPFGLRFFSMLAAFGVLVVLARLIVRMTKSEKAGLVFAVLYSLSCLTFGYGHLGTPLMLGIFFFTISLRLMYAFYAGGIKRARALSLLPLLFSGLFGAAAICVQGAFAIPMIGIIALFIAGMVRQNKAKNYRLMKLAEEAETLEKIDRAPVRAQISDAEETEETEAAPETPGMRAGKLIAEFRFKNTMAPILFAAGLVMGVFLLLLLSMLPAYFTYLKAYDNPAAPSMSVFVLAWKVFANGFVGQNPYVSGSARLLWRELFRGTGEMYAITAVAFHPVALVAGALGLGYAVFRLLLCAFRKEKSKQDRSEIRRTVILLAGFALSLAAAFAAKSGDAFYLLADFFFLLLGANLFGASFTGQGGRVMKIVNVIGIVLLVLGFAALAVFTFSVPLPAEFFKAAVPFLVS